MSLKLFRIFCAAYTHNLNVNTLILGSKPLLTATKSVYRMIGARAVLEEGLKLSEVVEKLRQLADERLAEKWDNVGLLIEPSEVIVRNIMLTNDLTENVLEEALEKDINLIISYHPPIFKPLKRITQETWKERIVATCLENKIALYSPHTAWDAVHGGVTDWLADAFSKYFVENDKYPQPLISQTNPELDPRSGAGRLVCVNDLTLHNCISSIKSHTGLNHVRIALGKDKTLESSVKVIAVVCGSGGSLLNNTLADLYVTGEMSHHELLEANQNGISVIVTNHSDSERGFLDCMSDNLGKIFYNKANVFVSQRDKDPLITV